MPTPDIIEVLVDAPIAIVEVEVPGQMGPGGLDGTDGTDGADGVSVTGASIDGSGHLILTLSSGGPIDVGVVVGADGSDGADGADGVSITGASVNGSGHLILTLSTGGTVDAGLVKGADGADGADGVDGTNGTNGVSITGASVDASYHLILTLSSGGPIDAGYVRGPAGAGTGDVVGVAPSVAGNFAAYTDTTGKEVEDSGVSAASFATSAQGTKADTAVQPGDFHAASTKSTPVDADELGLWDSAASWLFKKLTFGDLKTWVKSWIAKGDVGLGNVVNVDTSTQANVSFTGLTAAAAVSDSDTLPVNQGAANLKQTFGAIKTWVNGIIATYVAAQDLEVLKGAIDCAANPNYPAADAGHVYRVSVAGKIGGASGVNVEAGDRLECFVDGTASGNHATVGANWMVSQVNIDGAVVGPTSGVDGVPPLFDGTSGRLLKSAGTLSAWRTAVGLAIGSAVQAYSAVLDAVAAGITLSSGAFTVLGTSSGPSEIRLREDTDSGTNHVGFKAPASLSADAVWEMPAVDGSNGQVLKTNGSKVLSFGDAGGGHFVLLGTVSPAGATSVVLTGLTTDYDEFIVVFSDFYGQFDGVNFVMEVSINGGSSYLSANYYYGYQDVGITTGNNGVVGASNALILTGLKNSVGNGVSGEVRLFPLTGNAFRYMSNMIRPNGTSPGFIARGGVILSGTRVNAVKFIASSGALQGKVTLLGVKNT